MQSNIIPHLSMFALARTISQYERQYNNNDHTSILQMNAPESPTKDTRKKPALTDSPKGIISFTFTYRPYIRLTLAPAIISTQNIPNYKSTTQVFNAHSFCTSFSVFLFPISRFMQRKHTHTFAT